MPDRSPRTGAGWGSEVLKLQKGRERNTDPKALGLENSEFLKLGRGSPGAKAGKGDLRWSAWEVPELQGENQENTGKIPRPRGLRHQGLGLAGQLSVAQQQGPTRK